MRLSILSSVVVLVLCLQGIASGQTAGQTAEGDKLQRKRAELKDVGPSVKETLYRVLGNAPVQELFEITWDGIVIMYETTGTMNRKKFEIVVRPNGERIASTALGKARTVAERDIEEKDLPAPVGASAKKYFGDTELTQFRVISYRTVPVLYSIESELELVFIAVDGDRERLVKKPPPQEDAEGEMPPDAEEPDGEKPDGGDAPGDTPGGDRPD